MKRRILGLFASILTFAAVTVPAFPVGAEEDDEPTGQWILSDTLTWSDTGYTEGSRDDENYKAVYGEQTFPYSHRYYVDAMEPDPGSDYGNKYSYFWLETNIGYTGDDYGFLPESIDSGTSLTLELTGSYAYTDNSLNIDETSYATVSFCDPSTPMTGFLDSDEPMVMVNSINEDINIPQASATFDFPAGKEVGEEKVLSFRSTGNETRYVYKWETEEVPEDIADLGTWKLVEQYLHTPSEWQYDAPDYLTKISYGGEETSYLIKVTHDKKIDALPNEPNSTFAITFSGPPPASFSSGEHLKIDVSLSITGSSSEFWAAGVDYTNDQNAFFPYLGTYVDENVFGIAQFEKFIIRDSGVVNSSTDGIQTAHLIAPIPEHPEKTAFCGIRYYAMTILNNQDMPTMMYTDYIYEWNPDPDAVAGYIGNEEEEGEIPTETENPSEAHVVIEKDAKKDAGEDNEKIPAGAIAAILGGFAAAAGGGATAAAVASKKKGKKDDKKKNEQPNSTFEMRIHKDFGDTIYVGDEAAVYARIVEISENGQEKDRPDLTSRIKISSPEYLVVKHEQMSGKHKAAVAYAYDNDNVPDKATISFSLANAKGSFTENVVFNIAAPAIIFFQNNLTLPAIYDQTEELPFLVAGMESPEVTIKLKGKDYEAEVAEYEKNDYGTTFVAKITEKKKTPLDVGETTYNILTVTAESVSADGKKREITEQFYIYRMGMGLILDVSHIGCYINKNGEPAVTKGHMMLLTWDEEKHEIIRAAVAPKTFKAVSWFESKGSEAAEYASDEIQMVRSLGIQLSLPEDAKIDPDKGVECEFRCTQAVLDSPQILRSDIIITAEFNGKTYETRKEFIELTSQPMRNFRNEQERKTALENDKKIEKFLKEALATIKYYKLEGNLYPMVTLMNIMLDKYDKRFGYDERRIEYMRDVYTRILNTEKAMIDAEIIAQDQLAATFFGKCSIVADFALQYENSMSLGKRLLIGVGTFGGSEIAFASCKVYRSMRDAVINSDSDNALVLWSKSFTVGIAVAAWEIVKTLAFQEVMKGPAHLKGRYSQVKGKFNQWKAGKTPDINAVNQSAKALNGNVNKSITSKINAQDGTKLKLSGQKAMNTVNEAKISAEKAINASKNMPLSEADKAFEKGVELSRVKLEKLAAAQGDEFVELAKSVQLDKYSITLMKRLRGDAATELRKRFNNAIQDLNKKTIDMTRQKLAKQYKCDIDDIVVFRGSSNSMAKLKNGSTTTYDLDVTYRVVKDGVPTDIPQNLAQKLHNESCHRVFKVTRAPSEQAAQSCADGFDHSVVQKASAENFGSDSVLEKLVDPSKQGVKMTTSEAVRAGETIAYKGAKRLRKSEYWAKEAVNADTATVRESAFKASAMEKAEGMRSIVKDGDLLRAKDQIAVSQGSTSAIPKDVNFALETYRKVGEGTLTPDKAAKIVQDATGMDPDRVCEVTGQLLAKINNNLAG